MHRVKSEEVKRQTSKRIGKENDLRESQQQKLLDSFKYASWKKSMDEFEKIIAQSNKKKCVKEQILIVQLGLVFEEAHCPCSRDRYEYYSVKLPEQFVKVCLPHTKNNNLPKEAPMENPRLEEFPTLGTLAGDIDEYYLEQAKNDNQIRLEALGELENE